MSFRELRSVDDITAYYRHGIELYGIESPRTMGYQTAPVDDRLIKHLLPEKVQDSYSVLDVGCGLGQIVPILSDRFPKSHLETLLGIDLVDDFIQHCVAEFPAHEFVTKNFLEWDSPRRFDIVLAAGVLVTRIDQYETYLARFIEKMISASKGWVGFNVIAHQGAGYTARHLATISSESLTSVLAAFPNVLWQINKLEVFTGSHDTFVCGTVRI
jgi:trans-aconitate methyltransferase